MEAAGAGVNITPVSFLIVNNGNIKLMPVEYCSTIDKIADYIPDIIEKTEKFMANRKKEKIEKEGKQTISYTYDDDEV